MRIRLGALAGALAIALLGPVVPAATATTTATSMPEGFSRSIAWNGGGWQTAWGQWGYLNFPELCGPYETWYLRWTSDLRIRGANGPQVKVKWVDITVNTGHKAKLTGAWIIDKNNMTESTTYFGYLPTFPKGKSTRRISFGQDFVWKRESPPRLELVLRFNYAPNSNTVYGCRNLNVYTYMERLNL
ncbi:MAG: hypothetical protein M3467_04315 [Actinomycetota bacterium]|jgi:hypothetical protein|nr:hypothetical protein [Actinomycetota bacterium]